MLKDYPYSRQCCRYQIAQDMKIDVMENLQVLSVSCNCLKLYSISEYVYVIIYGLVFIQSLHSLIFIYL